MLLFRVTFIFKNRYGEGNQINLSSNELYKSLLGPINKDNKLTL
jgi:hypothetical protein